MWRPLHRKASSPRGQLEGCVEKPGITKVAFIEQLSTRAFSQSLHWRDKFMWIASVCYRAPQDDKHGLSLALLSNLSEISSEHFDQRVAHIDVCGKWKEDSHIWMLSCRSSSEQLSRLRCNMSLLSLDHLTKGRLNQQHRDPVNSRPKMDTKCSPLADDWMEISSDVAWTCTSGSVSSHASAAWAFMSLALACVSAGRLRSHVNGPDVALFGYLRRCIL